MVGTNWSVTTLAGLAGHGGVADGTGSQVRFNHPLDATADDGGNLWVVDADNDTIRKGSPALLFDSSATTFNSHNGQFALTLQGQIGRMVVIEASNDLESWAAISTNLNGGTFQYIDPETNSPSARFYRAQLK
jgi:hypothetical protein